MGSKRPGIGKDETEMLRPDAAVLSIKCPKCLRVLTSRRMHAVGLSCDNECGETMLNLAAECSRVYKPLTYMMVDTASSRVMYVGTTEDLPKRLAQHSTKAGKLSVHGKAAPTGKSARMVESALRCAGVRMHVALHGYERLIHDVQNSAPEWNLAPPPVSSIQYRCVRQVDGMTEVHSYAIAECAHRDADALGLATGRGNVWTQTSRRRASEVDELLGEMEVSGVGRVDALTTVHIGGRTQHEWAVTKLKSTKTCACYRAGVCGRQEFYGYCRCPVPCGLRWSLLGEPEERRARREAVDFQRDRWYMRQGVIEGDDAELRGRVAAVMLMEGDDAELRDCAREALAIEAGDEFRRLVVLKEEIATRRARSFYGTDVCGASTGPVYYYLQDRRVWRTKPSTYERRERWEASPHLLRTPPKGASAIGPAPGDNRVVVAPLKPTKLRAPQRAPQRAQDGGPSSRKDAQAKAASRWLEAGKKLAASKRRADVCRK